jgi:hypothetical protein
MSLHFATVEFFFLLERHYSSMPHRKTCTLSVAIDGESSGQTYQLNADSEDETCYDLDEPSGTRKNWR